MHHDGFPEKYHLFSFVRLHEVARFLGAPAIRNSSSPHYRGASEMLDAHLETQVGHEVAFGHITAEQALQVLSSEHPAEELNGYAEMSDSLRYGVEDGQ